MPFLLFRKYTDLPVIDNPLRTSKSGIPYSDPTLPYIHPYVDDEEQTQRPAIFVTVRQGSTIRLAAYSKTTGRRIHRMDYMNESGRDLTGLPAWFPHHDPGETGAICFGNGIRILPQMPKATFIGSPEWPNDMTWRHVHGNYYIVTIYRRTNIVFEHLVTDKGGRDLKPVLGLSSEQPGEIPFSGAWLGEDVTVIPNVSALKKDEEVYFYNLIIVNEEDLPEDFPKNLVKWIP